MRRRSAVQVIYDLGRRLAELREDRGLTQASLAATLGMSDIYLRKVESGRVNLTVKSLDKFAKALDTEIGDLFVPPRTRARRGPGRPSSRST